VKQFRTPYFFRWIFHQRVWGFSHHDNSVYLTFDDGPTPNCTKWILDILDQHKVKATFFCVGENAKKHSELLELIVSKGHGIGNHTMHHEKGTKTKKTSYLESVEEASKHVDSNLFRPPYGRIPMPYAKALRKKYKIIMWTWLSYDYDPKVSPSDILNRAKDIKSGDILVLHDNNKSFKKLQEVLPELIVLLKKKGLQFATISA
jgi:peptidoglycan/xylan/chitin deacetylase (PgdA/CDA1 family)